MLLILALASATATVTLEPPAPAALPIPPALPMAEAAKGNLRAVGTEPFWRLDIVGTEMTLTTPGEDGDKIDQFKTEYSTALGDTGHVWTSGPLSVTVTFAECSDGMSDTSYPYTVDAVLLGAKGSDTQNLKGCAYRPWGQDVVSALPVIDACLALDENKPPVVYAGITAPDSGYVMLAGGDENPLNACTVLGGKATVAGFDSDASPAGTNSEIFVRGPGQNPGGECYDAPEVKDADGKVVGWWLDPEGC
jgi:uncharacterized membrane protein